MHAIGWGVPGVPGFRQISECLQILKPIEDLEVVLDINSIHSIDWTSSYSNNADSQRESVQIKFCLFFLLPSGSRRRGIPRL